MEALAVLRLSDPPRRNNHRAYSDDEDDDATTPYASAPSSPRRAFTQEVEEAPLGEVRAAIPFAWELVPGTPKNHAVCVDETEETGCSSEAASTESLSRDSSKTDFDFVEPARLLVSSLRLPPRLQHLRSLDSSPCCDVSFKSPPRLLAGSSKLTALCGFTKTTDEETTTILGMEERTIKRRSLSPLRCRNREAHFASDRSSFSSSSSSSSASSTNANSPQDSPAEKTSTQGSMLKDILFTDLAMASGRNAHLKPRQVQSKLELLQKNQSQWNKFAHSENVARPALPPQLSRPIARSRSASIDTHVKSLRKENIGRAVLANRFGMLYACLGMSSESP